MQEELRLHKKDGRERLNIAITHSSTRNFLSHTLTPQCQKRRNEKKAREREERERESKRGMRRREVKRAGTRALCFILIYIISALSKHRLIHKHGHQYSQRQERQPRCDLLHHIEQSVQGITHIQPRRSSVLTHASFPFHRDISVHLFLSALLLLFASFIVCRYVHVAYTDERESKVHRYSQRTWSGNRNV